MTQKPRSTTMNRGAIDERAAIIRKGVKHEKAGGTLAEYIAWIRGRRVRISKRRGGLGRN
jgi:hypothetical protein